MNSIQRLFSPSFSVWQGVSKRIVLSLFVFVLCVADVYSIPELNFVEVQPVDYGRSPTNPGFYRNGNGQMELIFEYSDLTSPGGLYISKYLGAGWTNPEKYGYLNYNTFELLDVEELAGQTSMMLIRGDDTDYTDVLNIVTTLQPPENDTDPFVPSMSNSELGDLLADNQKLFYSLNDGSGWSEPLEIASTSRALNAQVASDGTGGAIVVYLLDMDGNPQTYTDIELHYAVYKNNTWSVPDRLTSNNVFDYGYQVEYVNGSYLIVWVADQDGSAVTINDSQLRYSLISAVGAVSQAPLNIVAQLNDGPAYALGSNANQAVLVWTEKQLDGSIKLVETRFDSVTGWSSLLMSETDVNRIETAEIYWVNNRWLLVFKSGSFIGLSLNDGVDWQPLEKVANIANNGVSLTDLNIDLIDDTLWIALSSHIKSATDVDLSQGDGLYVAEHSISYDLSIENVNNVPPGVKPGQPSKLNIEIINNGLVDAPAANLEILKNGTVIAAKTVPAIMAKESVMISHGVVMDDLVTEFDVRLINNPLDSDPDNDAEKYTLTLRPDFIVKSVYLDGVDKIMADVRETKGVASASVPVIAYLVQNGAAVEVANAVYDPSTIDPVELIVSELATITGDYSVVVRANPSRGILEDNYINNTGALKYTITSKPDFEIRDYYVDNNEVRLRVVNSGEAYTSPVNLVLSDDSAQVSRAGDVSNAWYYQAVALDDTGEASVVLPRSGLPVINGQYLYAAVNPYGAVQESNRNNNVVKKLVDSLASQQTGNANLSYLSHRYVCSNLGVEVTNTGSLSAMGVKAALKDAQGFQVAASQIPMISAGGTHTINVNNLDAGSYYLVVSHRVGINYVESVNQQVSLQADNCNYSNNSNDVELGLLASFGVNQATGKHEFELDITVNSYPTDYRKPLVRVPLEIEIKQGTMVVSTLSRVMFVPSTSLAKRVMIKIDSSFIPVGPYRLVVRSHNRLDEIKSSNNIASIMVSGG